MLGSILPAVQGDLLVRWHISHVIHFALLALIHGLVGLLVPPAETEAFPEASWKSGNKDGKTQIKWKYTNK